MANICHISPDDGVEISQNFNTVPFSSNKETFDTFEFGDALPPIPQTWPNKRRRKYIGNTIANRIMGHELSLPKDQRGSWNHKKSFIYESIYHQGGEILSNDLLREYRKYLLDSGLTQDQIALVFQSEGIEKLTNKYSEGLKRRTDKECSSNKYFYNHSSNIGNQNRWKRMLNCWNDIDQVTDKTNNKKIYKVRNRCNDKLCLNCSQIRSQVAILKYQDSVNKMHDPVMVVLHMESPGIGQLKDCIQLMYECQRSIFKVRAKSNKENYNGITALEVTTNNQKQTYHPHYHIIIEKHQAEELVNEWIDKMSKMLARETSSKIITRGKRKGEIITKKIVNKEARLIIKNKMVTAHTHKETNSFYSVLPLDEKTGKVNIKELFKYAMKLSVTNQDKPSNKRKTIGSTKMIYEIAKALQGVQQWRPFGNFRETPNTKEIKEMINQEMTFNQEEHPWITLSNHWQWDVDDWKGKLQLDVDDWEAWIKKDKVTMSLIGSPIDEESIAFLRLTKEENNTFVNEKRNQFERSQRCEIFIPSWNDERIQEVPGSQIIERSIHHNKPPSR